jgi:cell division septation protein DedD
MKHLGKLTTLTAAGAVAFGLLLAPSGAGASSTTTSTTTPAPATTTKSATPAAATTTKSATPAVAIPAAKTTVTTGRWTVLVASFATKKEAATQLAQLRKLGFKHFHVVHVGTQYVVRERQLHHTTATKLVAKLKAAGIVATAS